MGDKPEEKEKPGDSRQASASPPAGSGGTTSTFERILIPVGTALLLLLVFFGYYYFYVKERTAYLTNRNFRHLAILGQQLSDTIGNYGSILKDFGSEVSRRANKSPMDGAEQARYLSFLAPGLHCFARFNSNPPAYAKEPLDLKLWDGDWTLNVNVKNGTTVFHGCQRVSDLASGFMAGLPFDDVLVATSDGTVIYQKTSSGPQFTTIESLFLGEDAPRGTESKDRKSEAEGDTGQTKTKTKQKEKGEGPQEASRAVGLFRLPRAPGVSPLTQRAVDVGGIKYRAFLQPVLLNLFAQTEREDNIPREWILCGLVRENEFQWQALSISYGAMIYLAAALLLVTLSVPFLKVLLINRREHFHVREALQTFCFAVLFTAVLTFVSLEFVHFQGDSNDDTDSQLESLAQTMSQNVHIEISLMFEQLRSLCGEKQELQDQLRKAGFKLQERDSQTHVLIRKTKLKGGAIYPYFESAFWTSELTESDVDTHTVRTQDWQVVKWSVREFGTPMIAVDDIPFTRKVRNKNLYLLHETHEFRLDSVQSPNKDEYLAVLGMPTGDCLRQGANLVDPRHAPARNTAEGGSTFLVSRMLSLIDPVLPIGYGFALVDDRGFVIFHSDKTRNNRENFLEETDHNHELEAAIYGKAHPHAFTLKYLGRDFRVAVTSIPGVTRAPWALIVFRDMVHVRTLNLETMMMAGSAYAILLVVPLFVLSIVYCLFRKHYVPAWLWPRERNLQFYLMQCAVSVVLLAAFVYRWLQFGTEDLIRTIFITTYGGIFFGVWGAALLHWPPRQRGRLGHGIAAAALGLFCFGLSWAHGIGLYNGLGVALLVFAGPLLWVRQVRRFVRRKWPQVARMPGWAPRLRSHYRGAYFATVLMVLILTAVLPALGFFHAALNVEYRLQAKLGQLHLSKSFQTRERTLATDFSQIFVNPARKDGEYIDVDARRRLQKRRRESLLDNYAGAYYRTSIYTEPHPLDRGGALHRPGDDAAPTEHYDEWFLENIYRLHYPYNEAAAQTLGVIRNRKPPLSGEPPVLLDPSPEWIWDTEHQILALRRHGFLSLAGQDADKQSHTDLVLCSVLTSRKAKSELWEGLLTVGVVSLVMFPLLWVVGRRIFLFHIRRPLSGVPAGQRRLILVDASGPSPVAGGVTDLRVAKPVGKPDEPIDKKVEQFIAALPPGKIVLAHFEYNLEDPQTRAERLLLLEQLVRAPCRDIDIVAGADLLPYITHGASPAESHTDDLPAELNAERWATVLGMFDKLDKRATVADLARGLSPRLSQFAWDECMAKPELTRIFNQVLSTLSGAEELTRDQLVQEMLDRAEAYYYTLWASCTTDEWFVLVQLAEDGMVNPKNESAIRQLLRKGLIRRDPFRLMNESFRLFVLKSHPHDAAREWERASRNSGWGKFKGGFTIALVMLAGFLLATQQELWQSSFAITTAIAGAVGTLFKLIGALQGRGAPEK